MTDLDARERLAYARLDGRFTVHTSAPPIRIQHGRHRVLATRAVTITVGSCAHCRNAWPHCTCGARAAPSARHDPPATPPTEETTDA